MKNALTPKQYLSRLMIAVAALVFCLAAFNWLINPLQLFNAPTIPGVNEFKTRFFFYQLINKPYQLRQQQPDTVILGSSRAGASLQTSHPAYTDRKAFNSALAGSGAAVQWYSFKHAFHAAPVQRMVLPLDLFMFNACIDQEQESPYRDYAERIAGQGIGWQYPTRWLIDHATALLALNTSYESWLTLQAQRNFSQSKAGLMHIDKSGHWFNFLTSDTQQRSLFHYIENQYLRSGWHPVACYPHATEQRLENARPTPLAYIQQIIDHAHKNNIELQLFFSPFHARLAEAMDAVGLWEQFEQLKRAVVQINERTALTQVEPRQAFPLWDFSGYNRINTEAVPERGDTATRMQWHRDATHVTMATGDIVQNLIFGLATAAEFPGFGRQLNSTTLESWLALDRIRRQHYREKFPAEVAEVRAEARRAETWRANKPQPNIPSWLK